MLNPAIELGTNICPWNCEFCFTESSDNPEGHKRRLQNEMSLAEKLSLIDNVAALGARSINFVGAGEPTIDPNFWQLIERMRERSITPIIYTEASLRLTQVEFVRRLFDAGATVVVKMNSFSNAEYQNSIVRGNGQVNVRASNRYTELRNEAVRLMIAEGFTSSEPTRLAFDTIICRQNYDETLDLHRFARDNNIFVLFVNYLPSGRSTNGLYDALSRDEQFALFEAMATVDRDEYGITHRHIFPYAGGVPCSIRGLGIFIKITGETFDCPGELISLGNVRQRPVEEVWAQARPVTLGFNGGCAPREEFWKRQSVRRLPLLSGT